MQNYAAKVALYARRSPEDKEKRQTLYHGEHVSDSIESQLLMLHQFANECGFIDCKEYKDDNVSGTTFKRDDFIKMLEHIKKGVIDTVIVKDLSRLGRDYIESGRYQEIVFPEMGVRLIAVNDNYDSATGAGTDTAVFKNVFNDYYVRDISNKTRSALKARATAGKYLASGVYGYQKDPNDKNKLIPDPETAPVVRRIFDMAISGFTYRAIAAALSEEGILTPTAVKGNKMRCDSMRAVDWCKTTIKNIVQNPVYLGTLVYGKTRKVSYKSRKQIEVPESEQIVVEHAHEPLVSKSVWDMANANAARHKKVDGTHEVHIFSGLLFCECCGCSMTKHKPGNGKVNFICHRYNAYGRNSENGCTSHRVSYNLLYATILSSIQEVTEAVRADREGLIEELSGISRKKQEAQINAVKKSLATAENRLEKIDRLTRTAFEQNATGELEKDEYARLMNGYRAERGKIVEQVDAWKNRVAELTKESDSAEHFVSLVEQYVDITELDRELLHRLIDRVEIKQGYRENGVKYQPIDIYFRFVGKI